MCVCVWVGGVCACVRGGRGEEERRGARGGAEGEEGDAGRKGREREGGGEGGERGRAACLSSARVLSLRPPLPPSPLAPGALPLSLSSPPPALPPPFLLLPTRAHASAHSPPPRAHTHTQQLGEEARQRGDISYLVDPASSHMLSSKAKPCMSKYKGIQARNCERLITTVVICTALSPS